MMIVMFLLGFIVNSNDDVVYGNSLRIDDDGDDGSARFHIQQ